VHSAHSIFHFLGYISPIQFQSSSTVCWYIFPHWKIFNIRQFSQYNLSVVTLCLRTVAVISFVSGIMMHGSSFVVLYSRKDYIYPVVELQSLSVLI